MRKIPAPLASNSLKLLSRLLIVGSAALAPPRSLWAQQLPQATSLETKSDKPALKNESSAGIVIATGNSRTQTYNLAQLNSYSFGKNVLKFDANLLKTESDGAETARNWHVGLRYDRALDIKYNAFVDAALEADPFAGTRLRQVEDIGGKYFFRKTMTADPTKTFEWFAELGYRYNFESRTMAANRKVNIVRLYSEAADNFTDSVKGSIWVEVLQNVAASNDYQINTQFSVTSEMTKVFSLKTAYLVKYNHQPNPGTKSVDQLITTSLVAKF